MIQKLCTPLTHLFPPESSTSKLPGNKINKMAENDQQQAQGPKTPRPIRSERTEWVRTWYALGTLVYGLGYYGGVRTIYGASTEWVQTEGGVG